jgi:hypothetical protein
MFYLLMGLGFEDFFGLIFLVGLVLLFRLVWICWGIFLGGEKKRQRE